MRSILAAAALIAVAIDDAASHGTRLAEAETAFLNARYETAAELALELRTADPEDLAAIELRATALLFQLKDLLPERGDRDKALAQCAACRSLLNDFFSETTRGQTIARARLKASPEDETSRFMLGKIDLNYLWMQLGPLGRKTGWDEYWEARHSLDAVLAKNPAHVRAQVARAWIDYVVDTRMPWGTKWLFGGGSRKRARALMQAAAAAPADLFAHAEARYALWELNRRERSLPEAIAIAQQLSREFPENRELTEFLDRHK